MPQLSDYDAYIFDCDGVIFDSNQLKIKAMEQALTSCLGADDKIIMCLEHFKNNFGTSRFSHIRIFVEDILDLPQPIRNDTYSKILNAYGDQCEALYLEAELTPGVIEFIEQLPGKKYIASGSEQQELQAVFKARGLDIYFEKILGSPESKENLVSYILTEVKGNAIFFGDAKSDMKAALNNAIDFIAYIPFSNVAKELQLESIQRGFLVIDSWSDCK